MYKFNNGRGAIICDKCRVVIKDGTWMMTKEAIKRYSTKKTYCSECVQDRIKQCEKEKV